MSYGDGMKSLYELIGRPVEVVRLLAQAVDAHGEYFPGHSDGVAYVVRLMGSEMGYEEDYIRAMQVAALLHDTGKLFVPAEIIGAPRRLTDREYATMTKHADYSGLIARNLASGERSTLKQIAHWVRHHHERWDGKGYPDGLHGEEIPFESRLIFVADAFHVMTSNRPYQPSRSRAQAIEELLANAGSQFDPHIVDILADRHGVDEREVDTEGARKSERVVVDDE